MFNLQECSRHRARHLCRSGIGGISTGLASRSSLQLAPPWGFGAQNNLRFPRYPSGPRADPPRVRSDQTGRLALPGSRQDDPERLPKRALLRRCTPHISSLPHPQFYPFRPPASPPSTHSVGRGSGFLPGERSAASRRAASGRGRPRLLSEKKRALSKKLVEPRSRAAPGSSSTQYSVSREIPC